MKKNNKKLKLFSLIFLILFCLYFQTVAYSAINSTMTIKGDAYARVDADVRITNFKLSSSSSNSTSSYEEFSVNTIASKFNLLDSSSSIVFDVEVTNYGSSDVGILQLVGTVPTGLSYEIINYNLKDKICDDTGKCNQMAVKTFQIKFTGTPGEYEITQELDFRTYHKVTYTDVTNNNYPTEVIDGGNLSITFTENLKKVTILSDGTEIGHYDQINSGQTITIENISNDIEIKKKEPVAKLVSGKINEVGSEVCIKDECFYIISNDGSKVTMLAKYNLHVGYVATPVVSDVNYNVDDYKVNPLVMTSNNAYMMPLIAAPDDPAVPDGKQTIETIPIENPSGIQDASAKGITGDSSSYIGVDKFSEKSYWTYYVDGSGKVLYEKYGTTYPAYVYDTNSNLYSYIENYKIFLQNYGIAISDARLISHEELLALGCSQSSCMSAPSWVYSTSYWTGSAYNIMYVKYIESGGDYLEETFDINGYYGVRPVIEMSVDDIYVPPVAKVISGDLDTVGSEICIKDECFYVISSDDTSVTMLAKYNLYVGGEYNTSWTAYGDEASGKQDSTMLGLVSGQNIRKGTTPFASTKYWSSTVSSYPAYVYDSNSILYDYIENYKTYLSTLGVTPSEARLITKEELETLGCSSSSYSCNSAPSWVYATSYWSGSAYDDNDVWSVLSNGVFGGSIYSSGYATGVRPVITISKSLF